MDEIDSIGSSRIESGGSGLFLCPFFKIRVQFHDFLRYLKIGTHNGHASTAV